MGYHPPGTAPSAMPRNQEQIFFLRTPKSASVLFDGNPATAWCANPSNATIHFRFRKPLDLYQIEVLGGHFASRLELERHGRVHSLLFSSGSTKAAVNLQDPLGVNLKSAIESPANGSVFLKGLTSLDVKVESIYDGSLGDVCISEMTMVVLTEDKRP